MRYPNLLRRIALLALALSSSLQAADTWTPLFNGKDLAGWTTYLAAPHPESDVPGLKRDAAGKYLEPIGTDRDPLAVFKVSEIDGRAALHISGQFFGVMTTKASYSNYHLRLQFKWGEKRWKPRAQAVRDSGLLYHVHGEAAFSSGVWPRCVECQIQEHDTGDLYAIGTQITVRARATANRWIYDPTGEPTRFLQEKPIGNRCIKLKDVEKSHGEWNTVELICFNGDSIHIVNGEVVMRLHNAQRLDGTAPAPLTSGQISLQTEGAEVFYRDVELRTIDAIPAQFAEK